LERLGEPFYRPDVARTRSTGGSGLGLSIVRESIAAMRGQVRFANLEPRGFAVTLELVALELGDLCPDLA
jgi:two-component system sensor histidine kinase CpxA